jgi:hypothetical protein
VQGFKAALQAETLLKLLDRFDSDSFRRTRKTAATACVSKSQDAAGAAIEDVLVSSPMLLFWWKKAR